MTAHGGIQEVPKECCWHKVSALRSWPPRVIQRCCWCKAQRQVEVKPDESIQHGPYA